MVQYSLFPLDQQPPPLPALPAMPPLVRYRDRYGRKDVTLKQPALSEWSLHINGGIRNLRLSFDHPWIDQFIRAHLADRLIEGSVTTVMNYGHRYIAMHDEGKLHAIVFAVATLTPNDFQKLWIDQFRDQLSRHDAVAIRSAIRFACAWEIGRWHPADLDFVRALPGHDLDKYKGVRDASSFLPTASQSQIVEFIDQTVRNLDSSGSDRIRVAAILALSFQFGLRRSQIASLEMSDFTFHSDDALHIRVELLKQRRQKVGRLVTRRMQQSWVPILRRWIACRPAGEVKFFGLAPERIGTLIADALLEITGASYSSQTLRHTSAQRLVDAGISHESLSDFLGHTDTTAAQVYFAASQNQAKLVNMALGYSPTYQGVAAAARGDMITAAQLLSRPVDQQISGMPHGVPISGIGACQAGQSSCQRNPVLACYTCHKFLPVADPEVHATLLVEMRDVVRSFDQLQLIDRVSPAMMQLRVTLEAIEEVVGMASAGASHAV